MASTDVCGGYDADFETPLSTDFTCCVCFLAFREPMQLPCGHQFCRSCLELCKETQVTEFKCPMDREIVDLSKIFPDKAMERKVLSLIVKCRNTKHGKPTQENVKIACSWKGELRGLSDHTAVCIFVPTKCSNEECPVYIPRVDLDRHVSEECRFRDWVCDHCRETIYWKDHHGHHVTCKCWPVKCINSCGIRNIPRQKMVEHMKMCPLSIQQCSYVTYGCDFAGTIKQREIHVKLEVQKHLKIAVEKICSLENELKLTKQATFNISDELQRTNDNMKLIENKLKGCEKHEDLAHKKIRNLEGKLQILETTRGFSKVPADDHPITAAHRSTSSQTPSTDMQSGSAGPGVASSTVH